MRRNIVLQKASRMLTYAEENARRFVLLCVNTALRPLLIISVGGPIIIHMSHVFLLSENQYIELLTNRTNYGLVNYQIQLYTLIVAWIIILFECKRLKESYRQSRGNMSVRDYTNEQNNDSTYVALRGTIILNIACFVVCFLLLSLWRGAIVDMYAPAGSPPYSPFSLPPLASPITWGRILVTTSAVTIGLLSVEAGTRLSKGKALAVLIGPAVAMALTLAMLYLRRPRSSPKIFLKLVDAF